MFKLGQEVMVKKDLVGGNRYYEPNGAGLYFSRFMERYRGKIYKITSIEIEDTYLYRLEGISDWVFSDSMFVPCYTIKGKLEEKGLI